MPVGSRTQAPAFETPPISGATTPSMGWDASSAPVTGFLLWITPSPEWASVTISAPPPGLAARSALSAPGCGMVSSAVIVRGDTRTSCPPPSTQIEPPANATCPPVPVLLSEWTPAFSSPVTMSVRGSSRTSSRSPTDTGASVIHSDPAAYSGALRMPGLNVFEAMITPVAGSTRDSVTCGGYGCTRGCQVRYRLPPVKVSDGSLRAMPKMLSRLVTWDAPGGEATVARAVPAGRACWPGWGLAAQPATRPTVTATAATTTVRAAGSVLMPT